ncbi:hypothetical protein L1987_60135 [Smallanthus sonchifolius]|uniref:Uncharacterized protein n=1 Tax=Smallanthus sonchifolius TaxID=185202 RepID=A0ACB9D826_9ASTR|nr:hypothetical protein L1987_60135 [Smallanthus sonchifolius]
MEKFSAPSYNNVPLPMDEIHLAKQNAQEIAHLSSTTPKPNVVSSIVTAPGGILMITEISAPVLFVRFQPGGSDSLVATLSVLLPFLRTNRLPSSSRRFTEQELSDEASYYGIESQLKSVRLPNPLSGIDASVVATIQPASDGIVSAFTSIDDGSVWIAHGGQISVYDWNLTHADIFSVLLPLLCTNRFSSPSRRFTEQELSDEASYYGIESQLKSVRLPNPLSGIDASVVATIQPASDGIVSAFTAIDDGSVWIAQGGQISVYDWNLTHAGRRWRWKEVEARRLPPDASMEKFSAPSFINVPPPMDEIHLAKQNAQEIAHVSSTTPKPSVGSSIVTAPGGILMITEISAPVLLVRFSYLSLFI